MYDSTAKISSGILNGNVNLYGDFDNCLNVQHPTENIKGKYCLTYMQAKLIKKLPKHDYFYTLMQSHGLFKSEFNDVSNYNIVLYFQFD